MRKKNDRENASGVILATAYECLSSNGYANVSLRNIADRAGVALSQLAYHYKNKETLFSEVIRLMMGRYLSEIESSLRSEPDARDRPAALVRYFKELIREDPKLLRLFLDFTAQSMWVPSFREQLDGLFNAITDMIEKNLPAETASDRILGHYSPKSIAALVFGTLFGTSVRILLGPGSDGDFESLNLAENILN